MPSIDTIAAGQVWKESDKRILSGARVLRVTAIRDARVFFICQRDQRRGSMKADALIRKFAPLAQ